MRRATALAWLIAGASVALLMATSTTTAGAAEEFAGECNTAETEAYTVTVGRVDCFRLDSSAMGALVPVGYYVPPACDPTLGRSCPVLYYTHGTGGSYREGAGTKGTRGNAWVAALTSGPAVDPRSTEAPWEYADPATWVPKPSLDLIIVAPHGRTLPGGHGPAVGADTGWFDWHPRYAEGGDSERYPTPPPRPSGFLFEELIPFVDSNFPTDGTREQRAILGYSQGGFGSYINGLLQPDLFATVGMRSGGAIPVPLYDTLVPSPTDGGLAPPAPVPSTTVPGVVPSTVPEDAFAQMLIGEATVGWGDPVADHAWFRHSNPIDLMPNARAWGAAGSQSVHFHDFVNDAILRRTEDYVDLNYLALFYETLLHPMNLYMDDVFEWLGVDRTLHVGPGDHTSDYGQPYFREQLEAQYQRLRHWDGGGEPGPAADTFDYRTIREEFAVWGWSVSVTRDVTEFLNLTNVSCDGLTLRGSGQVEVTVPPSCRTGMEGSRTFTVDLGPSQATDELGGVGSSGLYGNEETVVLTSLQPCPVTRPPHC